MNAKQYLVDNKLINGIMAELKAFVVNNYYSTMPVIKYHMSKNRAGFYCDQNRMNANKYSVDNKLTNEITAKLKLFVVINYSIMFVISYHLFKS